LATRFVPVTVKIRDVLSIQTAWMWAWFLHLSTWPMWNTYHKTTKRQENWAYCFITVIHPEEFNQRVILTTYRHTHIRLTFFFRTIWVSRHQKGKPFWILLKQEMMGWQWHQLDYMQIICTTLQTDNHASTPSLNFLRAGCSSWCPTNSVKALKAKLLT